MVAIAGAFIMAGAAGWVFHDQSKPFVFVSGALAGCIAYALLTNDVAH